MNLRFQDNSNAQGHVPYLIFQANREKGRKPLYFPERYGVVVGTGEYDKKGKYALIYKAGKLGNIMISLEISADDIILIYNKYVMLCKCCI